MKRLITLILGLIIIGPAYAQTKVDNFYKATTAAPVNKKVCVMDVIYKDGHFDSLQVKSVKNIKQRPSIRKDNKLIGPIIDEANIINFKADTLYVLYSITIQNGSVSEIIKTHKGIFKPVYNEDMKLVIRPIEDTYNGFSTQWRAELAKKSDFLLYSAVFNWDIDLLIRIIKASAEKIIPRTPMIATRIIIKDNKVLKKDIINFDDAGTWVLNRGDLLY